MSPQELDPIIVQRAIENVRQERETFNQSKKHENRWFSLRLIMGYLSVILIPAIMFVCSYIIFNAFSFEKTVVNYASAALFVDVLGLVVGVWKVVLNPASVTKLKPVTEVDLGLVSEAERPITTNAEAQSTSTPAPSSSTSSDENDDENP